MANSLANNFWIVPRLFQYSGGFSRYCLTDGIFAKAGWTTHEHETALPPVPSAKKRLLRLDDTTKTYTSLKTKDKADANRLLMAINEAAKCDRHNCPPLRPQTAGMFIFIFGLRLMVEN